MKGEAGEGVPGWGSVKAGAAGQGPVSSHSRRAGGGSEYGSSAAKPGAGCGRDLLQVTWNKSHLSCWL